jgi:Putative Ig domain
VNDGAAGQTRGMTRRLVFVLVLLALAPSADAAKPKTLTILPRTLPLMRVGTFYAYKVRARHGTPPYHYELIAGAKAFAAQGLKLDSPTGTISGSPRRAGLLRFTVAAGDAVSVYGVRRYIVRVLPRNGG